MPSCTHALRVLLLLQGTTATVARTFAEIKAKDFGTVSDRASDFAHDEAREQGLCLLLHGLERTAADFNFLRLLLPLRLGPVRQSAIRMVVAARTDRPTDRGFPERKTNGRPGRKNDIEMGGREDSDCVFDSVRFSFLRKWRSTACDRAAMRFSSVLCVLLTIAVIPNPISAGQPS